MPPRNHEFRPHHVTDLKSNHRPTSNAEENPDRGSGDESMTDAQAAYLRTLSEQAYEPDAFSEHLSMAEASKRIDILKAKLKLFDGPPHTA
jgi:Protein of unknown function (DUF3072)